MRTVLALLFLAALPVDAQTATCTASDSYGACLDKLIPALQGEAPTAAAEEAKTEDATETAVTGVSSTVSPAESSLKDFLSLLALSMDSATTSQEGQNFTFDWNPGLAFTEKIGFKLQATFAETQLNDEVTTRLASNAAEIETLRDSLEFGDDTTLSAFVQPRTAGSGRSIESQRVWYRPMRDAILATRGQELTDEDKLQADLDIVSNQQLLANDENGQPLPADQVQTRIERITAFANQVKANRAVRDRFFQAFAKLLNNQPQFYTAAQYHARRNLIGPNAWSGKLTYELAGNNLNAFRRANPNCKAIGAENAAACASALVDYATALRRGIERISVSAEYHRVNRRWIHDENAALDFGYPRSRTFVGSAVFGMNTAPVLPFRTETNGVGDARFDLTVKYELPSDDNAEAKGLVGALTYTQKVSDAFSFPVSLVFSDHESDLLNVQKRFGARFGLSYKLPDFN